MVHDKQKKHVLVFHRVNFYSKKISPRKKPVKMTKPPLIRESLNLN